MLKVDPSTKTLVPVSSTTLTQSHILERAHLQESIVRSWDAFISELGCFTFTIKTPEQFAHFLKAVGESDT